MRTFTDSLDRVFDPRDNALNAWRLVLATTVILWHSWPLTGHALPNRMAVELLASVPVDAFFAISGFLITWSWMRNPNLRQYFTARCLRIFPGLWVCVIIIAFVIAPISILIQGSSVNGSLTMGSRATFILAKIGRAS